MLIQIHGIGGQPALHSVEEKGVGGNLVFGGVIAGDKEMNVCLTLCCRTRS